MYVRMYVCTYVRMYVCTYVCMYVCTYVRIALKTEKIYLLPEGVCLIILRIILTRLYVNG